MNEKKRKYEVEHTLDFGTIIEDLGILCRKTEACYEIISWKYIVIVIDSINHVVELAWIIYNRIDTEKWNRFQISCCRYQKEI